MKNVMQPLVLNHSVPLRTIDERLVSYNIEMTEVTGGTFWKSYTPAQIEGTEVFPPISNLQDGFTALAGLMQYYPPIDLSNQRIRTLAKELGPAWIRVSGTWATKPTMILTEPQTVRHQKDTPVC